MSYIMKYGRLFLLLFSFSILLNGCNENDNGLAPYSGSPSLSQISIEKNSFEPKITWIGGYVTALGVNENEGAVLNQSLIWLLFNPNDKIKYPALYADLQSGSTNIAPDYGGTSKSNLSEDVLYTFWVVRGSVWNDISAYTNYKFMADSNLAPNSYRLENDSVMISIYNYASLSYQLDVYVNLDTNNVQAFGRLGQISVEPTNSIDNFIVSWIITQADITDSTISAIGLCEGDQYDINKLAWEIWSEELIEGETVFGKKNVIQGPLLLGQQFNETKVFAEFPETGLKRAQNYYLWIATKEWDGARRGRTVPGYAYLRFTTW